ncbi:MAG: sugar transferase [Kiritimatiellae bacterium]|nr:sugar transferase [Kiritimatiellia bacterium]
MLKNSLFKPLDHGEYSGCYLFNEHGRGYGRLPLSNCLIALAAIIFLLPLYILIMGAILVVDGAPVVFSQLRFGRDNTVFRIYKFRTMSSRAEKLHSKMQQRWGQRGHLFKMDNDPRITYLGGFLRKTFLDELPQLVNVVKGDMCLVGARPLPASDEGNYEKECHRLRQRGVPGVTGLWQVSGRNELTFDQMCLLDYYYYCNRSWKLDLKILIRTVKMVLNIGT